jgi:hypothetical protein
MEPHNCRPSEAGRANCQRFLHWNADAVRNIVSLANFTFYAQLLLSYIGKPRCIVSLVKRNLRMIATPTTLVSKRLGYSIRSGTFKAVSILGGWSEHSFSRFGLSGRRQVRGCCGIVQGTNPAQSKDRSPALFLPSTRRIGRDRGRPPRVAS